LFLDLFPVSGYDGQRRQTNLRVRGTVSATRQYRVYREVDGPGIRDAPFQPRRNLRQMRFARILQIGAFLQVPGILGWLSIYDPGMRGRNNVRSWHPGNKAFDQLLHGARELVEFRDVADNFDSLLGRERITTTSVLFSNSTAVALIDVLNDQSI
jgi:hypothetical protein